MTNYKEDSLYLASQNVAGTTFEYDFYSGSQITVMLGDVLVDNAVSINYKVEQTRAPVFGYASQYWSFMSDGHVIVTGALAIAFKESGYLLAPIQRFLQLQGSQSTPYPSGQPTTPRYYRDDPGGELDIAHQSDKLFANATFMELSAAARHHRTIRSNIEQTREWRQNNAEYNQLYYNFWHKLGALPDRDFEDWAEKFEDAIWYGSDTSNPYTREKLNSKNVTSFDDIEDDELILSHRRADQYLPVDIWITYGDTNNQNTNHTVRKLMDVQFVGQSQTIQISGEPVFEVYNFIARNVV